MPATAHQKGVRMSPRKVSVVAALVRGRSVEDALTILDYTPRLAAGPVRDAIKSAAANAEHNHNYKPGTLEITEISVTHGPRLKRFRKGRGFRGGADPFQRPTSHIKVVVDGEQREIKKTRPAPTKKEKETV